MEKLTFTDLAKLQQNWRENYNIMQCLDALIDHAYRNNLTITAINVGRKEFYELKRDWKNYLTTDLCENFYLRGIVIKCVNQTSELCLIIKQT